MKWLHGVVCFWLMLVGIETLAEEVDPDPWQGFNRSVFAFNETLDRYIGKPVAIGYQRLTPQAVDDSVTHFFSNLDDVLVVGNDLLQLKFSQAVSDIGRVLLNTTVGFFGVFDVATSLGLEKHNEDIGQTLGYWGVGAGPYLVLPLLGPSTLRDSAGLVATSYSGVNYSDLSSERRQTLALSGIRFSDIRADLIASEGLVSGDRYTFFRSFYLQRRQYLIQDGQLEDDFGDEDFEDEDFEDEK